MHELSRQVTESYLWRSALAPRADDPDSEARERLRLAFTIFRQRAGLLSDRIRGDLPHLTLHDLTHLDALWETASTIVGTNYALTPAEVFVLGGAFLLHDLGMALPAIEGGVDALKRDPRWSDLVTYEYQTSYDRSPTTVEIESPVREIHDRVLLTLLQQLHAAKAERLLFVPFSVEKGDEEVYLVDDPEVRQAFGRVIGRVAHSHWWTINEVERQFQRTIGAAHWCPRDWNVDPLKLACVLRCADAAQIDGRRAPLFLRATTELPEYSVDHWTFQGKLNKPYLLDDALVFTTGHAFNSTEASSWWLCLETLQRVDNELGAVDALFADKGVLRFAARRVAGIEEPERMVSYLPTEGWLPINATIHVTELPRVIKSLGGEELYGKNPEVALRELIQNAADAVRARRVYERRPADYGNVLVRLGEDEGAGFYLEVSDNGIGMSRLVLTSFLLDFGRPFWGSAEMQREFPGLLSSGIRQTGKYGIGFFSAFMIANHVQVVTRRSDAAANDTLVLEFSRGLRGRPILRRAAESEHLLDGGTRVRLRLEIDPTNEGGLLQDAFKKKKRSLKAVCAELCPSLDVDLCVEEKGKRDKIVEAGDWCVLESRDFVERLPVHDLYQQVSRAEEKRFRREAAKNLRILRSDSGDIVGRALITVGYALRFRTHMDLGGVVSVGGLRSCSLSGIAGVLTGVATRAARDAARPVVSAEELRRWAEEQVPLIPDLWTDQTAQAACAQYVRLCGGHTGSLPIAIYKGEWCSADEVRLWRDLPDELILLDEFVVESKLRHLREVVLRENLFVVVGAMVPGLLQCRVRWPGSSYGNFTAAQAHFSLTLVGALVEAIAEAWGVECTAVTKGNDLEGQRNAVIGHAASGEITENAIVLKRPTPKGRAV